MTWARRSLRTCGVLIFIIQDTEIFLCLVLCDILLCLDVGFHGVVPVQVIRRQIEDGRHPGRKVTILSSWKLLISATITESGLVSSTTVV